MAMNEVFKIGQSISVPVTKAIKSGDPVRVGVLNGVAIVDKGDGGQADTHVSIDMFGGYLFELAGVQIGDPVYITSAGKLTKTEGGNKLWGAVTHKHRGDFVVILPQPITV